LFGFLHHHRSEPSPRMPRCRLQDEDFVQQFLTGTCVVAAASLIAQGDRAHCCASHPRIRRREIPKGVQKTCGLLLLADPALLNSHVVSACEPRIVEKPRVA
jgi:hypothetical protein